MKKIAIVGGGISGLYFANKLQREKKFDYTIYEKKSGLDLNNGYGIQLSVNSVKLLNEIGFKNVDYNEKFFPKKINFFNAKNSNKICDIDISTFNEDDNKYTTIKRSSLIKFLLNNIPGEKIKSNIELKNIKYGEKLKLSLSNNLVEEFDYLVVSDGVFSKTKSIIFKKDTNPKFFNSVALRANIRNIDSNNISLYLGSNFHFVVYPVNQNKEFNFISIIRKKIKINEILNQSLFESTEFLNDLINEIYKKTSLDLKGKLQNVKSFPIYVSEKFENFNQKNIYFVGDALFALPPTFAQGASQSIESSNEAFDEINNNLDNYYKKRCFKITKVNWRSKLNHFAFHLSNPFTIFLRNLILKILVKNKIFLNGYLGRIYKD